MSISKTKTFHQKFIQFFICLLEFFKNFNKKSLFNLLLL